jgi:hypothetical protein
MEYMYRRKEVEKARIVYNINRCEPGGNYMYQDTVYCCAPYDSQNKRGNVVSFTNLMHSSFIL